MIIYVCIIYLPPHSHRLIFFTCNLNLMNFGSSSDECTPAFSGEFQVKVKHSFV